MWQQIIVNGGEVVASVPVESWLLSAYFNGLTYLPFPEVVLSCFDLSIINLAFMAVIHGMSSNSSKRGLEIRIWCQVILVSPRTCPSTRDSNLYTTPHLLASRVLSLRCTRIDLVVLIRIRCVLTPWSRIKAFDIWKGHANFVALFSEVGRFLVFLSLCCFVHPIFCSH